MSDTEDRRVKGYQLGERLGAGGFGVVYRATQLSIGREVAIKAILPVHANAREFIQRFENEAQLVATWDFVYQNVIRYFYLIYPGMFLRLPFQNEATAQQNATIISQLISKDSWNTTPYMPVSRDLSDGKRRLLQRWCALNE